MKRTPFRRRPHVVAAPLLAVVALSGARAATVASVGEVRFVDSRASDGEGEVFTRRQVERFLRPEVGRDCDPERAAARVAGRYQALGYVPHVEAECDDGTLEVRVRESSHRIVLVTCDPGDLKQLGLAATRVDNEKLFYPVPESAPRRVLLGLVAAHPGDLYNVERYRIDRVDLARLGYVVLFVAAPAEEAEHYPRGAYLIQSLKSLPESGERAKRNRSKKPNYFGGTAGYAPRSGGSAGLVYQRQDLWESLDSLTVSPTVSSQWGGQVSYTAPFLAARAEPHRLYDLSASLFSQFTPNRLLDGEERDQRDTGGALALGARLLSLPPQHDLHLQAEIRREAIDLSDEPAGSGRTDLTIVRFSLTHDWRRTWTTPEFTLRTLPAIDWSVGGALPFVRYAAQSFLHHRMRSGFEWDEHVSGGFLDRTVPQFEDFSLGGVTTVRGFREDTGLGQGFLALQSEIWIPFVRPLEARLPRPGEEAAAPLEPRIARRLKLAVFADGGTVWHTPGFERLSLAGAGVGLRFVIPNEPLVIKLDYGWGLGPRGGASYPYVALTYAF